MYQRILLVSLQQTAPTVTTTTANYSTPFQTSRSPTTQQHHAHFTQDHIHLTHLSFPLRFLTSFPSQPNDFNDMAGIKTLAVFALLFVSLPMNVLAIPVAQGPGNTNGNGAGNGVGGRGQQPPAPAPTPAFPQSDRSAAGTGTGTGAGADTDTGSGSTSNDDNSVTEIITGINNGSVSFSGICWEGDLLGG